MEELYNFTNKYPDIVPEDTFENIKKLFFEIEEKESQLSDLNSQKINLELSLEKLRSTFNNFRGLIEIKKIDNKPTQQVTEVKTSSIFGIISSGEGNTRIG